MVTGGRLALSMDADDASIVALALSIRRRSVVDKITLHSGKRGHESIIASYVDDLRRIDKMRRAIVEPQTCPSGTPLDVVVRGHHCNGPHS